MHAFYSILNLIGMKNFPQKLTSLFVKNYNLIVSCYS